MIMSSNKCYGRPAEHLFPVHGEEGQVGCKYVGEEVRVVCRIVLLRIKVLTHATYAHTTKKHISYVRYTIRLRNVLQFQNNNNRLANRLRLLKSYIFQGNFNIHFTQMFLIVHINCPSSTRIMKNVFRLG